MQKILQNCKLTIACTSYRRHIFGMCSLKWSQNHCFCPKPFNFGPNNQYIYIYIYIYIYTHTHTHKNLF